MDVDSTNPPNQLERLGNEIKEKVKPSYLGVALIGVGTFVLYEWGKTPTVNSLGEAILIAGILTLVVDTFLKARLIKEASKGVFHWMLGFNLPPQIQERLTNW
jgi:hypothetical protein